MTSSRPKLALTVLLAVLAAPATADAATISIRGGVGGFPLYRAAPGEANDVTVTRSGGSITFVDAGVATITHASGGPCAVNGNHATCPGSEAQVEAGDLEDTVTLSGAVYGRLYGGEGADTLSAGTAGSEMTGKGGGDVFNGGSGADRMYGGGGADVFNGGAGTDTASYEGSNSAETVNVNDLANDGSSDDGPLNARDNVKTDVEEVIGGNGGDTLVGSGGPNTLRGGHGADVLIGGGGNDWLAGGGHDDTLRGDGGADRMFGDSGTDWASYTGSTAAETVSLDGHSNDGSANDGSTGHRDNVDPSVENVRGGSGGDRLGGGKGYEANVLEGADGPDALSGGKGEDQLLGGAGDDVLRGGTEGDVHRGGDGFDVASYAGSTQDETVTIGGAPGEDGSIDDHGELGIRDDVQADVEAVRGGEGDDRLTGDDGANLLEGGEGEDTLAGGPGPDVFAGGGHVDTVSYAGSEQREVVDIGGSGGDGSLDDGLAGDEVGADVENLLGGNGSDTLTGSAGPNRLEGGGGDDQLTGGEGSDVVVGGAGWDTLVQPAVVDGADDLDCGPHALAWDVVSYDARTAGVSVTLDGTANDGAGGEGDNVRPSCERISGGSGWDTLIGDDGPQALFGGAGIDLLIGAGGPDTMNGGSEQDELIGGAGDDFLRGGPGDDIETGGEGADRFDQESTSNGADDLDCGTGADGAGDRVSYANRSVAIFVEQLEDAFFDGENADGANGGEEGDNVRSSCERIEGGAGDDDIYGGELGETLIGGTGDDELIGGGGVDLLQGGHDNDLLWGQGDGLADALDGGTGTDSGVWDAGLDSVTNLEDTNPAARAHRQAPESEIR